MIREHVSFFRKLEMACDVCLAGAAFFLLCPAAEYLRLLTVFLIVWLGLLYLLGAYESFRIKQLGDMLLTVCSAACFGVALFGSAAYLFKMQDLSRYFVLFVFFSAAGLICVEKILLMFFFRYIRRQGYNFRNILLVGTGPRARQFMNLNRQRPEWGLKIVGLIDEDAGLSGKEVNGCRVLGTLDEVADIVHANVVDDVVCIVPRSWMPKIETICFFCETEGITAHIALDMFELKFAKARQTELENFLLLSFERTPVKVGELFLKAVFDIVVAAALLTALIPLLIVVSIAVKLSSPGPVLYRQVRCGLNGRTFLLYKFRTMVVNADTMLDRLKRKNEMSGPVFKMENDPRITPLGKILRKFSIDELPQLWNVLKRDMSLVGPRPPLPEEVKRYDSWQRRRLSMRPGLTCLWQVQGRNKITDFNEWANLDLWYIDHWSFWQDLKILVRTVPVVLFGIGAK